jgi:RNA polymerase sigma factor (sigma-70 family)
LILDAYDPSRGIPLRPYLVRQLTSSIYTYSRQRWRRQKREINLDISLSTGEPSASADPSRDWDNEMITKQVLRMLPESIAILPARQRKLIVWRYYDAMSFEEIAAILNIQVSTARSILRHGLNNLRKTIGRSDLAPE